MEAEVCVTAENPVTGERVHTNTAYLVYVTMDADGKPAQVPALQAETPEDERRLAQAVVRQQQRLAEKTSSQ